MSDNSIPLREHIEAILSEREKALVLTAKALSDRLDYERELHESEIGYLQQKISQLDRRHSWLIGVGATLVVVAGIAGDILGHHTK